MSLYQELRFNDIHATPFDELTPNAMVNVYLMASYLYYVCDISPMTDYEYDLLCQRLIERYAEINHIHKHLIDVSALKAGTGFHLKHSDYPNMVIGGSKKWLEDINDRLGLSGTRGKKSEKDPFKAIKTITVIDHDKDSLMRGVRHLKLHNTKVTRIEPFSKNSIKAEVEYIET